MRSLKYQILLVLTLLTLSLLLPSVRAVDIQFGSIDTSQFSTLVNGTSNSTANTSWVVPPNSDLLLQPSFISAGTNAVDVDLRFNVSADLVHWSTTLPISITNQCNLATAVIGANWIRATNLTGVKAIRLDQWSTTATNCTLSALYYGYTR